MIMKKSVLIASVLALGVLATASVWAACSPGQPIWNAATGYQQNLTNTGGALGTTVLIKFWEVGNAAASNSGTLPYSPVPVTAYLSGYYLSTDWGNSGVVGCPAAAGRTAFLYSDANAGAGRYLIMSIAKTGANWNFDTITNGPGSTPTSVAIPQPTVLYASRAAGVYTAYVTWPSIANLKGYYDTVPGNNIITGVAIRYAEGATVPANTTGTWNLATTGGAVNWGLTGVADYGTGVAGGTAGTVAGSVLTDGTKAWVANQWTLGGGARYLVVTQAGATTAYPIVSNTATTVTVTGTPPAGAVTYGIGWKVTYPQAVTGGNQTYLALSVLFDGLAPLMPSRAPEALGLTETAFVGAASLGTQGPTPADLFVQNSAGKQAKQVTVSWRTNVETGVVSYEVFYAGRKNGNYKPVEATLTAPKGNNSEYSVTFPKPAKAAKFFVKVRAAMTDGTDQWSAPMKVGLNASVPELDD